VNSTDVFRLFRNGRTSLALTPVLLTKGPPFFCEVALYCTNTQRMSSKFSNTKGPRRPTMMDLSSSHTQRYAQDVDRALRR
jgi:hypothetical protein